MAESIRTRYMTKTQPIEAGDIISKQAKTWSKRFWLEKSNDFFTDYTTVMGLHITAHCPTLIGEK